MADEKSKANADRCNESGAVLLGCEHEDGEDQQCCQKHLDEEAASDTCVCGQRGCDGKFLSRNRKSASLLMIVEQSMGKTHVREQRRHDTSTGDGSNDFREDDHSEARVRNTADEG